METKNHLQNTLALSLPTARLTLTPSKRDSSRTAPSSTKPSLTNLDSAELLASLKSLVKEERRITCELVERIAEVIRRKLFYGLGYSSVLDWLTGDLGYSVSAAYRRLEAARLLLDVPELSEKLESGSLSLSVAAKLQTAVRQQEKRSGQKVSQSFKSDLVDKIQNHSQSQAEIVLLEALPQSFEVKDSLKRIGHEHSRLSLVIDDQLRRKLERVKELRSNASSLLDWSGVIEYLADAYLKRKDPLQKPNVEILKYSPSIATSDCNGNTDSTSNSNCDIDSYSTSTATSITTSKSPLISSRSNSKSTSKSNCDFDSNSTLIADSKSLFTSAAEVNQNLTLQQTPRKQSDEINLKAQSGCKNNNFNSPVKSSATKEPKPLRKPLSTQTKRYVFQRDNGCCSWTDPQSGRRCNTRFHLHIDHIRPLALNGNDHPDNLRLLCAGHHRLITQITFGSL